MKRRLCPLLILVFSTFWYILSLWKSWFFSWAYSYLLNVQTPSHSFLAHLWMVRRAPLLPCLSIPCSLFSPHWALHLSSAAHLDFNDQKLSQPKAPRRCCPPNPMVWIPGCSLEQWSRACQDYTPLSHWVPNSPPTLSGGRWNSHEDPQH